MEASLQRDPERRVKRDGVDAANDRLCDVLGEHDPPAPDERDLLAHPCLDQAPVRPPDEVEHEPLPHLAVVVGHEVEDASARARRLDHVGIGGDTDTDETLGEAAFDLLERARIPPVEGDHRRGLRQVVEEGQGRALDERDDLGSGERGPDRDDRKRFELACGLREDRLHRGRTRGRRVEEEGQLQDEEPRLGLRPDGGAVVGEA